METVGCWINGKWSWKSSGVNATIFHLRFLGQRCGQMLTFPLLLKSRIPSTTETYWSFFKKPHKVFCFGMNICFVLFFFWLWMFFFKRTIRVIKFEVAGYSLLKMPHFLCFANIYHICDVFYLFFSFILLESHRAQTGSLRNPAGFRVLVRDAEIRLIWATKPDKRSNILIYLDSFAIFSIFYRLFALQFTKIVFVFWEEITGDETFFKQSTGCCEQTLKCHLFNCETLFFHSGGGWGGVRC